VKSIAVSLRNSVENQVTRYKSWKIMIVIFYTQPVHGRVKFIFRY
jgi:hypothetical protein